jgi:polar amino acid transport system substrate-binding protein
MRRIFIAVLVPLIILSLSLCTAGTTRIVVGIDPTYPPMEMKDAASHIVGFDADLISAAAKAGGFTVELKEVPFDATFSGLASDACDAFMSSVTITAERKEAFDFSMPYVFSGQVLVVKADVTGVEKLGDLSGKIVAVLSVDPGGTPAFADYRTQHADKVQVVNSEGVDMALENLLSGKVAGVALESTVASYYVLHNPTYVGKLKIVGQAFTEEYYGIAVKKGNSKVLNLINAGLKKVTDAGEQKALEQKWLK